MAHSKGTGKISQWSILEQLEEQNKKQSYWTQIKKYSWIYTYTTKCNEDTWLDTGTEKWHQWENW